MCWAGETCTTRECVFCHSNSSPAGAGETWGNLGKPRWNESWHSIRTSIETSFKRIGTSETEQPDPRYSLRLMQSSAAHGQGAAACDRSTTGPRSSRSQRHPTAVAAPAQSSGSATGPLKIDRLPSSTTAGWRRRGTPAALLQGCPDLLLLRRFAYQYGRKSPADMQRSYLG